MNAIGCVEVAGLLEAHAESRLPAARRASVDAHLAHCASCGHAWEALQILAAERAAPVPPPRPELFDEAMRRAVAAARPRRRQGRFWLGAACGGALAASLVAGMLMLAPLEQANTPEGAVPELAIALYETRNMNVAIASQRAVADAHIRVTLTGSVAVAGFEDRSELSWTTHLDSGVNMLSLPVRMQGPAGGTVHIEVRYGERLKTFDVNVRNDGGGAELTV